MSFVLSSFLDYVYPMFKDAKEFVQASLKVLCDGDFAVFDSDETKKIDPSNVLSKLSSRGMNDVKFIDASKDKREYLVDGKYLCRYIGTTLVQDISTSPNGLSKALLYPISCDVNPDGDTEIVYNLAPLDGRNFQIRISNPNKPNCAVSITELINDKVVPFDGLFDNSMNDGDGLYTAFASIPFKGENILMNVTFNVMEDEGSFFYSTFISFRYNNEEYTSFITTNALSFGLMWGGQVFSFLNSNVDVRIGGSPYIRYMLRFPGNHQEFL